MHGSLFFPPETFFFREILHYNEKLMILKINLREQRSEDIFLLQTGLFIKHIVSETIV